MLASEALASGAVTRHQLRTEYVKLHRDVYAPRGLELTARHRAIAGWLWSRREAVLVGNSAAALLGTKWISAGEPAELGRSRFTSARGIVVRSGAIAPDELCTVSGIPCTTAPRTAYDVGRTMLPDNSIVRIDALLNATRHVVADVETIARRYPKARGIRRQIPVADEHGRIVRRIDMGWPEWMVGVEYDGAQHFTGPDDYAADIERLQFLAHRGWLVVRVGGRHMRAPGVVAERARRALLSRGYRRDCRS